MIIAFCYSLYDVGLVKFTGVLENLVRSVTGVPETGIAFE